MSSVIHFSCKKLVPFVLSFSFSVSKIFLTLFSFFCTLIFRVQGNGGGGSLENDFDHSEVLSEDIDQKTSKFIHSSSEFEPQPEAKTEPPVMGFTDSEKHKEEEKLESSFLFRFPTFEEFCRGNKENNDLDESELVSSRSVSKYEFISEKSYSGFVKEPEVLHFDFKQINVGSTCTDSIEKENVVDDQNCSSDRIVEQAPAQAVAVLNDENRGGIHGERGEEARHSIQDMGEPVREDDIFLHNRDFINEVQLHPRKEPTASDWVSESIISENANSLMSPSISSYIDDFLSDVDFDDEFEFDSLMDINGEKAENSWNSMSSDVDFDDEFEFDSLMDINGEKAENSWNSMSDLEENEESEDFNEEDSDILEELSKLEEEEQTNDTDGLKSQFSSVQDFNVELDKPKYEQVNGKDDKAINGSYDSEKVTSKDSSESGDANELETLWEHQELIEQLKMELRKVRATGLPTILEESESPKITEDLKPWKIEEKFHHEECMDELHKFYKSYRERMRKFDIFNYQKMYAMGFLQLKDPLHSKREKSSGPALKTLLSQNFWHHKHRISDSDPMVKFMKELQSDLEVVYVGQMCLSWEFLHWQYGKTLDLWDSDPRLILQYNEVAGEFQQFQVLTQRFTEDEPFQGPTRVQYYTKSRCVNRYLLQVPVIREDKKDRTKARKGNGAENVITSDMLVEMMEESIRILWRFIRADKDSCSAMVKGQKAKPTQLQNPDDLELLVEVRKILQKKERTLKEVLRSGNCILKRFRKHSVDDSDQVLYFFSQVDMKLVCRVLNMSKITTEQLIWCHSKLNRISFEQRKIQVEPSFLLFPC